MAPPVNRTQNAPPVASPAAYNGNRTLQPATANLLPERLQRSTSPPERPPRPCVARRRRHPRGPAADPRQHPPTPAPHPPASAPPPSVRRTTRTPTPVASPSRRTYPEKTPSRPDTTPPVR